MLFVVVCSFGIGGSASAAAPTPPAIAPPSSGAGRLLPRGLSLRNPLPDLDTETLRRDLLERTRRARLFLEDTIKMYERMAAEADALSDAEFARDFRRDAAKFRKELPRIQQQERRLWEEQPGGITAPAPRPVNR